MTKSNIRVEEYPFAREAITISNSCILSEGWTVGTLMEPHDSKPYNPDIARVFYRSGFIENCLARWYDADSDGWRNSENGEEEPWNKGGMFHSSDLAGDTSEVCIWCNRNAKTRRWKRED